MVPFGYYGMEARLFCLKNGEERASGEMPQEPRAGEREEGERAHESQDIDQDRKEARLARVVHDELSVVSHQLSVLHFKRKFGDRNSMTGN